MEHERDELQRLIRAQAVDDTNRQRPQRLGGKATVPAFDWLAESTEPMVSGAGQSGRDDGPERRFGRYKQHGPTSLRMPRGQQEPTYEARVVAKVVADLSERHQEAFRLVYDTRLTEREAADELGLSRGGLRSLLGTIHRRVRVALAE